MLKRSLVYLAFYKSKFTVVFYQPDNILIDVQTGYWWFVDGNKRDSRGSNKWRIGEEFQDLKEHGIIGVYERANQDLKNMVEHISGVI